MEFERTRVNLTVFSAAQQYSVVFQQIQEQTVYSLAHVTFEVIEALGDTEEEAEEEGRKTN